MNPDSWVFNSNNLHRYIQMDVTLTQALVDHFNKREYEAAAFVNNCTEIKINDLLSLIVRDDKVTGAMFAGLSSGADLECLFALANAVWPLASTLPKPSHVVPHMFRFNDADTHIYTLRQLVASMRITNRPMVLSGEYYYFKSGESLLCKSDDGKLLAEADITRASTIVPSSFAMKYKLRENWTVDSQSRLHYKGNKTNCDFTISNGHLFLNFEATVINSPTKVNWDAVKKEFFKILLERENI